MKQIKKMSKDELARFMRDLKVMLGAGEIDHAEFEVRRQPIKAEIERRMFSN